MTQDRGSGNQGANRPPILALDVLESYARERDVHVLLARVSDRDDWTCVLTSEHTLTPVTGNGQTAREAIMAALGQLGVGVAA
jgi:hypothetical protein